MQKQPQYTVSHLNEHSDGQISASCKLSSNHHLICVNFKNKICSKSLLTLFQLLMHILTTPPIPSSKAPAMPQRRSTNPRPYNFLRSKTPAIPPSESTNLRFHRGYPKRRATVVQQPTLRQ